MTVVLGSESHGAARGICARSKAASASTCRPVWCSRVARRPGLAATCAAVLVLNACAASFAPQAEEEEEEEEPVRKPRGTISLFAPRTQAGVATMAERDARAKMQQEAGRSNSRCAAGCQHCIGQHLLSCAALPALLAELAPPGLHHPCCCSVM